MSKFNDADFGKMSDADMVKFAYEQDEQIYRLQCELKNCRNELCLKCGRYKEAHIGACDDCRYRHGGEWSCDLDD